MKKGSTIVALAAFALTTISYLNSPAATGSALLPEEEGPTSEPNSSDIPAARPDSLDLATDSIFDETMLDDFVVVERRRLIQNDGATLTYNISEDPEAASSNILDILKKVPGVSVDGEDNVRVNGQTNFKMLINGREDPMLSGDVKSVLKSLPAASIKKVEVISEPGAKYSAEGTGGILNFVMDTGKKLSGFSADLSLWGNNYNVGGSINARRQIGNVMLGVNLTGNISLPRPKTYNRTTTEDLSVADPTIMVSESETDSKWAYMGPRFNLSWEPDTLNLFTIAANFGSNPNSSTQDYLRYMNQSDGTPIWSVDNRFENKTKYTGAGMQASYQHSFHRPDHTLVFSYLFDWYSWQDKNRYYLKDIQGDIHEAPFSLRSSDNYRQAHVIQLDYSNRLAPHSLIEAGAKVNIDNNPSDSYTAEGEEESVAVTIPTSRVDFSQFKDIYAVYASYSGTYGRWNAKAGLRYEHTRMGMRYREGDYPDFTSRLNDIVPNLAVSYNFTDASSLRLAYQMRIWRPGIYMVNPYVNDLIPGAVRYGNPNLESEKSHDISIGYSNYGGRFSGGGKVSYRYIANSITDVIFMKDGVINTTYANIGHYSNVSLDANFDWKISDVFNWGFNAGVTYMDIKANSEMLKQHNSGWQTNLSTNIGWQMPGKVRMSAYGGYWSPWIDLQSRGSDGYYYSLGFSRSFLKDDALTLQVNAGNFLPSRKSNKYTQTSETVRYTSRTEYTSWYVGVGLTFRFGGLKADVKKTAASVEAEGSAGGGGNK
ncbi:MAG: TonB-dependent receptor [Muribaculaceae bacterium]|nr:TonB-dependent receptor [Muribaculaceae bacterium]